MSCVGGEWEGFAGVSNSDPIDVIICCLGYAILLREISVMASRCHCIADLFIIFCGDPLAVNDEHGATARIWCRVCYFMVDP